MPLIGDRLRQRPVVASNTNDNVESHLEYDDEDQVSAQEEKLLDKVHQRLIETFGRTQTLDHDLVIKTLESQLDQTIREEGYLASRRDRQRMLDSLTGIVLGYGPLDPLLRDPEITEIMVNGPSAVFVERHGRLEESNSRFRDVEDLRRIIDRMVSRVGRRIDESSPMVDARLPDGSRINAVIPPLAIGWPALTIRKFSAKAMSMDDMVQMGSLDQDMADFLEACIKARVNILVSGGTGTGKTTTLNVLSSGIPEGERLVTVEDSAELKLTHKNRVAMEAREGTEVEYGAMAIACVNASHALLRFTGGITQGG